MIKHWLGKLFEFQAENDALQNKLSELSWDETFGMLTRNGFLYLCRDVSPQVRKVVFIDLDGIGDLNLELGYAEVDRRIKSIFNGFSNSNEIVARWYSGDEIVLVFDDLTAFDHRLHQLYKEAEAVGISFVYASGIWHKQHTPINEMIDRLSARVCAEKQLHSMRKGKVIDELTELSLRWVN